MIRLLGKVGMKEYNGLKVVAEISDSVANYGVRAIGVWVGCPNPGKYLHPAPKVTKTGAETYTDISELSNIAFEIPGLSVDTVIRIDFLIIEML